MIILLVRITPILHHVLLIHSRLISEVKRIYVKRIFCQNKNTHYNNRNFTEACYKNRKNIEKILLVRKANISLVEYYKYINSLKFHKIAGSRWQKYMM